MSTEISAKAGRVFESRGFSREHLPHLVQSIKDEASGLWDQINAVPVDSPESARLVSLAKTSLEESVMWAVKACSRVPAITSTGGSSATTTAP